MKKAILLLFLPIIIRSQVIIKGTVIDQSNNEGIAFASVGVKGKTMGTVCDENGKFELKGTDFTDQDSLKISAIGYSAKTIIMSKAKNFSSEKIALKVSVVGLAEVKVKPTKTLTKILGNKNYNKNVSVSFNGPNGNMKGCEISIKANNKKGRLVFFENFNFYITKNAFKDSLKFRLNFYKEDPNKLPGENILRKSVLFKISPMQTGLVTVDLRNYLINTDDDFFISLECLEEQINKASFCVSGSILGPSYFKFAVFADWKKLPVGGIDFNVTVSYQK